MGHVHRPGAPVDATHGDTTVRRAVIAITGAGRAEESVARGFPVKIGAEIRDPLPPDVGEADHKRAGGWVDDGDIGDAAIPKLDVGLES